MVRGEGEDHEAPPARPLPPNQPTCCPSIATRQMYCPRPPNTLTLLTRTVQVQEKRGAGPDPRSTPSAREGCEFRRGRKAACRGTAPG